MPEFKVVIDGKTYLVDADSQPTPEEAKEWLAAQGQENKWGLPSSLPAQPVDERTLKEKLSDLGQGLSKPANWPTIGATTLGVASSFTPLKWGGQAVAAGVGGGVGKAAEQIADPEQPFDITEILKEAAYQGGIDALFGGIGNLAAKGGARLAASGSGLSSSPIRRDFPTAVEELTSGGRFGMPIYTQSGVERVMRRTGAARNALIDSSPMTGNAVDIAVRGEPRVLNEALGGAALPVDETNAVKKFVQEFIDQHSTVQQIPNPRYNPNTLEGWAQPQTISKQTPIQLSARQLEDLKEGLQARSAAALKASNQGKFPISPEGRTSEGLAHGTQEFLEEIIPGIKQKNTKLQGLMGLGQAMNPTFRSAEELLAKGMSPENIAVATSPIRSPMSMNQRLTYDIMGAGGGFAASGGDLATAVLTGLGVHAATSPTAQRLIGGTANLAGRTLPNTIRLGRGVTAANTNPTPNNLTLEQAALLNALLP